MWSIRENLIGHLTASAFIVNKEHTKVWKGADALCVLSGGDNDNGPLNPTSGNIQRYLFGYEF